MDIATPPDRYVTEFPGKVIEQRVTWGQIESWCGKNTVGCMSASLVKHGVCLMWLPKIGKGGVTERRSGQIKAHEMAHCNGWPANHPKD